jgi:hypothetical protein
MSIVVRAERLITQRHLAVLRKQTGLMMAAGVVASIGVIMLNVAGYLALTQLVSPATSAVIVAVINLALAGVLVTVATRTNADAEVASVTEVRDLAMEDLEAELQSAADEVKVLAHGVRKMTRDPLGTLAPGIVGALINILLRQMKK